MMRETLLRSIVLAGLLLAGMSFGAQAQERCRIAFDVGSSGIRAGSSQSDVTARASINYLDPLWAGRGLDETVAPTIQSLRELPEKSGFPAECDRIAGGFSAWRLALEQDVASLVALMSHIRTESGVPILVIPQNQEGAYGYLSARQALGERLTTSHILDIGGGSLQLAGAQSSYGAMLGQKAWHRTLCQEIRHVDSPTCTLQPMLADELATARRLIGEKLSGIATELPVGTVSITGISRPVTLAVLPAMERLFPEETTQRMIQLSALQSAVNLLAGLALEDTATRTGASARAIGDLFSTMLLVEGVMNSTRASSLSVADVDLTNLPGLLADDRAFAWGERYQCYLTRLVESGVSAYFSDPATCP